MKNQRVSALIMAGCLLLCQAGAQASYPVPGKGSWETVENLPRGTLISVKTALGDHSSHSVRCVVRSVDGTHLVCDRWSRARPTLFPRSGQRHADPQYEFRREQVRQVRLENDEWQTAESGLAGAVAGATLGGVVGYNYCRSRGGTPAEARAGTSSLFGALIGAVIGRAIPFVRGRVIFQV